MRKQRSTLSTAGIISIVMGILILVFPNLLQAIVSTALILSGVLLLQLGNAFKN